MKNASESDVILSFFPRTKKLYRIDWLGDVCYPDKRASHRQPSIAVALSEVVRTNAGFEKAAPNQRQLQRFAPVGLLSWLRIGDIWQAGRRIDSPPTTATEFQNLLINQDRSHIIKAGVELNGKGFLIPFSAYTGHSLHTQSYCLLTRLPSSKNLVIPCAELIRFYFGSSSKLLSRLFTPPLRRTSLYTSAILQPRSGRVYLQLGAGMSGYSAADIGRIARSADAWHAAATIGTSLLQGSTRGQKAYPSTYFPFKGTTDLVVTGQWLPQGKKAKQTFLVHSIESCSHPFPFRTLQYRMGHSFSAIGKLAQEEPSHVKTRTASNRIAGKPAEVVNQDPSMQLDPIQLTTNRRPRFPDLEAKAVFRLHPPQLNQANHHGGFARRSQITAIGVADASGNTRSVRPAEVLVGAEPPDIKNAPKFLRGTLGQLSSISELSFQPLTESPSDGWCIPIHAMQEDTRPIDRRLMIRREGQSRPRRICVLRLSRGRHLGYLAIIEGKPVRLYFSERNGAQRPTLSSIIQSAALDFIKGGPSNATALFKLLLIERF
jgi:hypothetical protein